MKQLPILATGLLLFSISLKAGLVPNAATPDCGLIRLDSIDGSMTNIPVLDQGDYNDCDAVAAAEIVDAIRSRQGGASARSYSSAIEGLIGLTVNDQHKTVKSAMVDGDPICNVANYFKAHGSCDTQVFAGARNELRADADFLASSYLLLYPIETEADESPREKRDQIKKVMSLMAGIRYRPNPSSFKNEREFLKALPALVHEAESDLPPRLNQACEKAGRLPVQFSSCADSPFLSPKEFKKTEADLLGLLTADTDIPIAISYCSKILEKGHRYEGLGEPKNGGYEIDDDCETHESLIIGKRPNPKNPGKCEFLVHNSWGKLCDDVSPEWKCEAGKIWIDADTLAKNLIYYSVIR